MRGGKANRKALEAHLFDAFIPASYRAAIKWTAQQAEPWLAFLAHHLETTIGGSDFAWWLLRKFTPFVDHERSPGRWQRNLLCLLRPPQAVSVSGLPEL